MNINSGQINILLAEKKMTGAELAKRSGIARQNLSCIMKRGTCSPVSLGKIADGLGVPVSEIMAEGG